MTNEIKAEAEALFTELNNVGLKVVLVPATRPAYEGHMIRQVEERNPEWYRELFGDNANWRRDRTLQSLKRISKGEGHKKNIYDFVLLRMIIDRLENGYEVEGQFVEGISN